jgi:hypothetical protein
VVGNNDGAYTSAYAFNTSTGFGTKYSNPATIVIAEPEKCAFNPSGTAFGSARNSAMPILVYAWSNSTGYGTKYTDPAAGNYTAAQSYVINWSPDEKVVGLGHDGGVYVTVWPWSNSTGFGTKYSDPGTALPQKVKGLQFFTY